MSGVQGINSDLSGVLCGVGDSTVEVHTSTFSWNSYTPLAALEQSMLALYASNISHNVFEGMGGAMYAGGHAHVTVDGGSRVHKNTAGSIDPKSDVVDGHGGGLAVMDNASVILTGGSSVYGNAAGSGGGLYVRDNRRRDTYWWQQCVW